MEEVKCCLQDLITTQPQVPNKVLSMETQVKASTFFSPYISQQPNKPKWKEPTKQKPKNLTKSKSHHNPETYQTTTTDSSSCCAWAMTRSNWVSPEIGTSSTEIGLSSSSCNDPSWLRAFTALIGRRISSNLREKTKGFEEGG